MSFEQPNWNPAVEKGKSASEQLKRSIRENALIVNRAVEVKGVERKENFSRERFEHGKLDIDFIGLSHTPENLAQHRQELEQAVRDADFVILEGVFNAGLEKERPVLEEAQTYVSTPMDRADRLFFGGIEDMAKKNARAVVSLDPYSNPKTLSDGLHLGKIVASQQELKDFHAKAGYLGATMFGAALLAEKIEGRNRKKPSEGEARLPEGGISRRKVLQGGAAVLGTMLAGDGLLNSNDFAYYASMPKLPLHSFQDYRDVVIAEGIHRLSDGFSRKMKVAVIYGGAHLKGVREYLENPTVRSTKRKLYASLDKVAQPEMRAYRFEEEKQAVPKRSSERLGQWKETLKVGI